jgi:hypothetical protein
MLQVNSDLHAQFSTNKIHFTHVFTVNLHVVPGTQRVSVWKTTNL